MPSAHGVRATGLDTACDFSENNLGDAARLVYVVADFGFVAVAGDQAGGVVSKEAICSSADRFICSFAASPVLLGFRKAEDIRMEREE